MLKNSVYLYWNHFWPEISSDFSAISGTESYKISYPEVPTSPPSNEISGKADIIWNYTGTDVNAKVLIQYSSDFGINWNILTYDVNAASNTFEWNTENQ